MALGKFLIDSQRTWKNSLTKKIQDRDEELEAKLVSVVPAELRRWLSNGGRMVVYDLVRQYCATREYKADEVESYGFRNLKELKKSFVKLETQWKDVVDIIIVRDEGRCIRVYFEAVKKPPLSTRRR